MLDNPVASITIILGAAFAVALIMIVIVVDGNGAEDSAVGIVLELNQTRLVEIERDIQTAGSAAAMQHQSIRLDLTGVAAIITDTDDRLIHNLPTITRMMATQVFDIARATVEVDFCTDYLAQSQASSPDDASIATCVADLP